MKYSIYLYAWLTSFRFKTLPLAISSILVGNALAYWQKNFSWSIFGLTLITAILLQILSNLANDYGDNQKGADINRQYAPKRGIHTGELTAKQLLYGLIINVFLCIAFGLWLLFIACDDWFQLFIFIMIGILSIIAAITYTVSRFSYGYIGLGDCSVFLFFGLVSVLGSYYLQTKQVSLSLLFPAISSGLLSVSVLNINNLRDFESDKKHNKRTLVVVLGIKLAKLYHLILLVLAIVLFIYFSYYYLQTKWSWLFLTMVPFIANHLWKVYNSNTEHELAALLIPMVKITLSVNFLYSLGMILR